MRLQQRISVAILPAILGPLLLIGAVSFNELRDTARQRALESLRTSADQLAGSVEADLAAKEASAGFLAIAAPLTSYLLAGDEDVRADLYQPGLLALFTDYQIAYPENRELHVLKPSGAADLDWSRDDRVVLAPGELQRFAADLAHGQEEARRAILRSARDGRPLLALGRRLANPLGTRHGAQAPQTLGYLVAVFDLRRLLQGADSIRFGSSGSVLLADRNGRPWNPQSPGAAWAADPRAGAQLRTLVDARSGAESDLEAGLQSRIVLLRQPYPDLIVVASLVAGEVSGGALRIAALVCALILASLLATHRLVNFALRRVLVQPVQRLTDRARALSAGDLSTRVPVDGPDEIGELGRTLGDLARSLQMSELEVARREAEREQVLRELECERDRAESASRAKSEFLETMSHEIRTPMNGVLGMNELLLQSPLQPRQRAWAESVQTSGRHLLALIQDILDYARIETGDLPLQPDDFDLAELVEDVLAMFRAAAARKGLVLVAELPPAQWDLPVHGDAARLRQVLVNLLGNAVKFTAAGRVIVRVRHASGPGEAGLQLEIEDTGIGIAPELQKSIFEVFRQADAKATRSFGGAGLGLALSQRLLGLMGARLELQSTPGEGTCVRIRLPAALQRSPAAAPPVPAALRGRRALLIDADRARRGPLARQCAAWGLEVVEADGPEALTGLAAASNDLRPFDVILAQEGTVPRAAAALDQALRGLPALAEVARIRLGPGDADGAGSGAGPAGAQLPCAPPRRALLRALLEAIERGAAPPDSAAPAGASAAAAPASRPGHILLVEDNRVNQQVATAMLERLGLRVDIAQDGREAVERIAAMPFDLVFMDCQMPVMDGLEATARIRRRAEPGAARLPIIALTANPTPDTEQSCRAAGMDDFLAKPYTFAQLRELVGRWLPAAPAAAVAATDDTPQAAPAPDAPEPDDAATGAADAPAEALNPRTLQLLRELDPDGGLALARSVLQAFLEASPQSVRQIEDGSVAGDGSRVARGAHALKSSTANAGADALSELMRRLERLGRENRLDEARALLPQVRREYERAVAAMRRMLEETAP